MNMRKAFEYFNKSELIDIMESFRESVYQEDCLIGNMLDNKFLQLFNEKLEANKREFKRLIELRRKAFDEENIVEYKKLNRKIKKLAEELLK